MSSNRSEYPTAPRKTEAEAVAEIVRRNLSDVATISKDAGLAVAILAHPPGQKRDLESLERYLPRPIRKRAEILLADHSSFIDYVLKHKETGTLLTCEITEKGGSFVAILDYHLPEDGAAAQSSEPPSKARWGEHVCIYVAEHTPEWKRWIGISGKGLNQATAAQFIEDNLYDIANPEPATMLELVKSLEATSGVEFKSAIRLDNGDRQLTYSHTTAAKAGQQGDIEIPERFKLKIPVFTNGPAYEVSVRFRYRIDGGNLVIAFEVERPHKIVELALHDSRDAIQQSLQMPVLSGKAKVNDPAI